MEDKGIFRGAGWQLDIDNAEVEVSVSMLLELWIAANQGVPAVDVWMNGTLDGKNIRVRIERESNSLIVATDWGVEKADPWSPELAPRIILQVIGNKLRVTVSCGVGKTIFSTSVEVPV
jgi:hypothetical protein